ncbi:alanine--tRNA ligase, partial [Streptomyces griseus]|nr:alanine--tRNA ligase [Streptomyces griseus]
MYLRVLVRSMGSFLARKSAADGVRRGVRARSREGGGKTAREGTCGQRCGNFSCGGDLKEGGVQLAWEALTNAVEDGGDGVDTEKLWITVYLDDDEAEQIWR